MSVIGADPEARAAAVLGGEPRLEPLDEAELGEREWAAILRVREIVDYPRDAPVSEIFRTMCKHPDFFLDFLVPGITIMSASAWAAREREMIILRTGWLCGAPFEFGEHVLRARKAGLSEDEIARAAAGSGAGGWSAFEVAVLRAVEELHGDAMISDATWTVLAAHCDERQLIELPMIVGHYHKAAFVQNSLRFRLNPGNAGFVLEGETA